MERTATKWRIDGREMSHPQVLAYKAKKKAAKEAAEANKNETVETVQTPEDKIQLEVTPEMVENNPDVVGEVEVGDTVEVDAGGELDPEVEVEVSEEQKARDEKSEAEGYSVKSTTEQDYEKLKDKMKEVGGYFKLDKIDQKKYSKLKKQLGK